MIGMQFVWAGMSLEIGTIGWQGQRVETNMHQLWTVEIEQPVVFLTLAGRNNLLPVSL